MEIIILLHITLHTSEKNKSKKITNFAKTDSNFRKYFRHHQQMINPFPHVRRTDESQNRQKRQLNRIIRHYHIYHMTQTNHGSQIKKHYDQYRDVRHEHSALDFKSMVVVNAKWTTDRHN